MFWSHVHAGKLNMKKVRVVPDAQQTWLLNKDSQEFGVFRALLSHIRRLTPSTCGYTDVEH